ncbi:MAG: alpha/beta hydrolase [Clostridiales bacterium]|nr:alpha/beta hydrolase [Clostridiales bacterium]
MKIKVNGTELYYTQNGGGAPVVLLHGNGEDGGIFDTLAPELSKDYTVITVDSRGHGQSAPAAALDYREMAEDTAALIVALGLQKPALLGSSDGAILGLILAAKYPDLLSALISCGANTRPSGIKIKYAVPMKIARFFTRDKMLALMLTQPDITDAELKKITVPVLVLAGGNDMIKASHTKRIAAAVSGSVLKILPGETHSGYVVRSPKLYGIVAPFLKSL